MTHHWLFQLWLAACWCHNMCIDHGEPWASCVGIRLAVVASWWMQSEGWELRPICDIVLKCELALPVVCTNRSAVTTLKLLWKEHTSDSSVYHSHLASIPGNIRTRLFLTMPNPPCHNALLFCFLITCTCLLFFTADRSFFVRIPKFYMPLPKVVWVWDLCWSLHTSPDLSILNPVLFPDHIHVHGVEIILITMQSNA